MNETKKRKGDWLPLYRGGQFWPMDPRPEEIDIRDIAHALSGKFRWNCASRDFISVAEHSIHVSQLVDERFALHGLLHDAAEAYLIDLPKPLKMLPEFAFYREIEDRLQAMINRKFGLPDEMLPEVKVADNLMLAIEARDQLDTSLPDWGRWLVPIPDGVHIQVLCPMTPPEAEKAFLRRFVDLSK